MKKLIMAGSVFVFIAIFAVAPVAQADTFGDLQNLLNKLRDQVSSFRQTAAVGGGLENSGSGGFVPPIGYCPAGTVGAGKANDTLRCNGSKWVASSILRNNGTSVHIGGVSLPSPGVLNVKSQSPYSPAIYAETSAGSQSGIEASSDGGPGLLARSRSNGSGAVQGQNEASSYGIGVWGIGSDSNGIGVQGAVNGSESTAVQALQNGAGYGFRQLGANAKNYFQGAVGIGTENPSERLDLGGGNIKMGLEGVSNSESNSNTVAVSCSFGKRILSGTCNIGGGLPVPLVSFGFGGNSSEWRCTWESPAQVVLAGAICANIR